MTKREQFRYTEKCLYDYQKNLNVLEIIERDLEIARASLDVKAQNYEQTTGINSHSDPVAMRLERIENLEFKQMRLERLTIPITKMMTELKMNALEGSNNWLLLEILRLMYFGKNPPREICEELKISDRTFSRKRQILVITAIDYMVAT